jgi:HK97 family phage prohead protease
MERRFTSLAAAPCKVQSRGIGGSVVIGYAAVFYNASNPGTEYQLYEDLVERIMPGAFNRALQEKQDCRALFNHEPNFILGRVGAGTCKLSVDTIGLRYEFSAPDTQCGRDLLTSIRRGDISGSSFSFLLRKQTWVDQKGGPVVREIRDVDLYDVGPVTFPAYTATSAGVRAAQGIADARVALEAWRKSRRRSTVTEIEVKARMARLGL